MEPPGISCHLNDGGLDCGLDDGGLDGGLNDDGLNDLVPREPEAGLSARYRTGLAQRRFRSGGGLCRARYRADGDEESIG